MEATFTPDGKYVVSGMEFLRPVSSNLFSFQSPIPKLSATSSKCLEEMLV